MPEISVVVPVYKVEPYLRRCVDSILNQSFPDLELILVDDGSPDNCGRICDEYACQDRRVHVIHQENGGLSAARNAGIDWAFQNSDSQWVTFIDSDDWVHQQMLEQLLNAAEENNVDISICDHVVTSSKEPSVDPKELPVQMYTAEALYVQKNLNATIACAKLYRKSCLEGVRFPLGKIHEDEFTIHKILFRSKMVAMHCAPMYYYYQNFDGITNSRWTSKRLDVIEAIHEQAQYMKEHGSVETYQYAVSKLLRNVDYHLYVITSEDIPQKEKSRYRQAILKELQTYLREYKNAIPLKRRIWLTVLSSFPYLLLCWHHIKQVCKMLIKRK